MIISGVAVLVGVFVKVAMVITALFKAAPLNKTEPEPLVPVSEAEGVKLV